MAHIIKNPVGLYYNGELIGIITNPDHYPDICEALSPDNGLADTRPLHPSSIEAIAEVVQCLPETISVDGEEDDGEEDEGI